MEFFPNLLNVTEPLTFYVSQKPPKQRLPNLSSSSYRYLWTRQKKSACHWLIISASGPMFPCLNLTTRTN